MTSPQGFNNQGERKVSKLLKSLYGLKQASRNGFKIFRSFNSNWFYQSRHDYFCFRKEQNGSFFTVLVIDVIDVMIIGNMEAAVKELKEYLHLWFLKELGSLKYFLIIEVARSRRNLLKEPWS